MDKCVTHKRVPTPFFGEHVTCSALGHSFFSNLRITFQSQKLHKVARRMSLAILSGLFLYAPSSLGTNVKC